MASVGLRVSGGLGGRIAMKPDWKDAPEWAQWLAMDADGLWAWYASEPRRILDSDMWQLGAPDDRHVPVFGFDGGPNWTRSKEPRP